MANENKVISSLATLKVLSDKMQKDYIENFVPFIATLINSKNYKEIDVDIMCKDFEEVFGLKIPYHPMMVILNRVKKRGIIKKHHRKFLPVETEVTKYDFKDVSRKQERKQNKVLESFVNFCKENYSEETIDKKQATDALIGYLRNHDLEILFAAQGKSLLPEVKPSKKYIFLMSKFIKYVSDIEADIFEFIVEIATGHVLANAIFYDKDIKSFEGNFKNVNLYMDTGIFYSLLGVDGDEKKRIYIDFVRKAKEQGAKIYMFKHNYEEMMEALENSRMWVENAAYDPSKANLITRFFVDQGYAPSDIDRIVQVKVPDGLNHYCIEIVDVPSHVKDQVRQIDEKKLQKVIIEDYKISDPYFDEEKKDLIIQRDVKSIYAINKLRGGGRPRSIKEAKYLFVTTNAHLAFSNKKFEKMELGEGFWIPACLTDAFIGTLIWLQSPSKMMDINRNKIIADAYAAVQPDKTFLKKLVRESEKLLNEGKINAKEFYLLRASAFTRNMIMEKSLGSSDNFNDGTLLETIEEIRKEGRAEYEKKYLVETKNHKETKDTLERESKIIKRLEKVVDKVSGLLSWAIVSILFFILFFFGLMQLAFPFKKWLIIPYAVVFTFSLVFSIGFGWSLKRLRKWVKNYIKQAILSFFCID